MAGLRAFLMRLRLRFRPVSTPGPAATAVPADRSAELAAELQPSLTLLEQAQAQAQTIRERAAEQAARIRRDAERQATRITAAAADRVTQVRQEAAARAHAADTAQAAEVLARGGRDAARLRQRAQERMPALVDQVVTDLFRELDIPATGVPGPHDCPGGWCEGRTRWVPDGSPG